MGRLPPTAELPLAPIAMPVFRTRGDSDSSNGSARVTPVARRKKRRSIRELVLFKGKLLAARRNSGPHCNRPAGISLALRKVRKLTYTIQHLADPVVSPIRSMVIAFRPHAFQGFR